MKNGVFFGDMMSVFPTISPTCWHSIYTGAVTKVHGAVCEMIHHQGEDPWQFGTSYSDKNVHAVRIWDVVARNGGKSLLLGLIAVCADHGAIATTDEYYPMEILKNAGLTTYIDYDFNKLNWRNEGIDWSKTKAYCVGSCYVNVNLKGRGPCGIVEPEDYDKVVKEIIVALHEYGATHSGTHKGEFAFVVPGEQAGFLDLGGECCGDVVFGIMGGDIGGYFGDVHAVQIPSAKKQVQR